MMNFSAAVRIVQILLLGLVVGLPVAQAANLRAWGEVNRTDPYLQETLVYTLRVASDVPLATVDPAPPPVAGLSMEKLEGPITRYGGRPGETIVEYRYALIPLVQGPLQIPSMTMEVTFAPTQPGPYGPWYQPRQPAGPTTVTADAIGLNVRPPVTAVRPWLPLRSLHMQAQWVHKEPPEVGKPLTLRVVLTATGAGGEELPDLQRYLQTADLKVYPERPKTERSVSPDGVLQGRRITSYTLIPQRDGTLILPDLQLPWWNVVERRAEVTTWPEQIIRVGGANASVTQATTEAPAPVVPVTGAPSDTGHPVLLLIAGALLFGAGWWFGAGRPGLPPGVRRWAVMGWEGLKWAAGRIRQGASALTEAVVPDDTLRQARELAARVVPPGWQRGVTTRAVNLVPRPVQILQVMSRIHSEHDPAAIARLVQRYAHIVLRLPVNTPLAGIAQVIASTFTVPQAQRVPQLLERLDHALYGEQQFPEAEWKAECREACWRLTFSRRHRVGEDKVQGLPQLNPG